LPYGTASLFSTAAGDDGSVLTKEDLGGRRSGTGGEESVFCQWLAYEVYPHSKFVCSSWTAGPGQALNTLGETCLQKADALLVLPPAAAAEGGPVVTLAYVNYHGALYHDAFAGGCDVCAAKCQSSTEEGVFFDEEENEEPAPKKAATAAAAAADCGGRVPHWLRLLCGVSGGAGGQDRQKPWRPADRGDAAVDARRKRMAQALSAAAASAGLPFRVTYSAVHSCQLFHQFDRFRPDCCLPDAGHYTLTDEERAWGVRELMRRKHPDKVVFGSALGQSVSQQELLRRILQAPSPPLGPAAGDDGQWSRTPRFGGFCMIKGGRLPDDGHNFGYAHQRVRTDVAEVGSFTRFQAAAMSDWNSAAADQLLDKYCASEQTVSRRSYPEEGGELVGTDLLRWLVRVKGLTGFRIVHFIEYSLANFMNGFYQPLLQERHELKRDGGSNLRQETIKLTMNANYGGSSPPSLAFAAMY
jgi:hypothetical protein